MILEQMAFQLGLSVHYILKIARTASYRYKEYTVPKRTGGVRTIHHPARELKLLQYWLLENVLFRLPVHQAATAYRKDFNIALNAARHVRNNYILRVDFQNFFPSLKGSEVVAVLTANRQTFSDLEFNDLDLEIIRQVVCRNDALTIGAPTSPQLSNAIMFPFDATWSQFVEPLEVRYTRYADDLYFSTNRPNVLNEILVNLRNSLDSGDWPTLRINEKKTAFSSRKYRRLSAGLVLTSDRKISIGRHKKRTLKSLVNKLKYKTLEQERVAHLRGWIAYLRSVEPDFVIALQRKYGLDFTENSTWEV